ncbi:MAG: beta-ketoacyl synthase chain length factor [Giesbergeria sp.]
MTPLQVFVDGVGLYAPGLSGWQHARAVLAAPKTYHPAPLQLPSIDALPAAERRRLGVAVKLAMAVGYDAVQQSPMALTLLSTVFSSSAGDGDNCHHILEALASPDRAISPTRFHNSVHNAAAGYWHIATQSRQPSISLSAHDAGFGAALLETVSQICSNARPCLLVAFDTPYLSPLHDARIIAPPFGVALLLTPQRSIHTLCRLTLSLTQESAHPMFTPDFEAMRCNVPAARALPLLSALATQQQQQQRLVIEYLQGLNISITLQP